MGRKITESTLINDNHKTQNWHNFRIKSSTVVNFEELFVLVYLRKGERKMEKKKQVFSKFRTHDANGAEKRSLGHLGEVEAVRILHSWTEGEACEGEGRQEPGGDDNTGDGRNE